jgi:hypothetical protein
MRRRDLRREQKTNRAKIDRRLYRKRRVGLHRLRPISVVALIDGLNALLDHRVDGTFSVIVPVTNVERSCQSFRSQRRGVRIRGSSSGRFCHALSVASLVGFVGYWHSISSWTRALF